MKNDKKNFDFLYDKHSFKYPFDFNVEEYKNLNPDLVENLKNNNLIKIHFVTYGLAEGRKYKFKNLPKDFNPETYKNLNEDLKNLTNNELKVHYENAGFFEGRLYK